MSPLHLPFSPRFITLTLAVVAVLVFGTALAFDQRSLILAVCLGISIFLVIVGIIDLTQKSHAILRNYPIAAHLRFIFEAIRPEMRQYFFEGEKDGMPFSRDRRAIVYQRAKNALDVRPFGTNYDVYVPGYEWMAHSIAPTPVSREPHRILIGGPDCTQPYSASIFNISAMSFGSLSANAIRALNGGAKLGGFYHDTGEGGYSPYHREGGGDIVWEIGSGYFGARNDDGTFSPERFAEGATNPQVKMVELKLSQGAKPGHGGVLPAPKVSHEISLTRGVPMGLDCVSPSRHSAFSTPVEMMRFIAEMRRLSGGKPAGFKLCIGHDGSSWRSARRCWRPASIPTSSSSTARRVARARRPWSSSTISASRCGRASTSCTMPWSASACATASSRRGRQDHHRLRHRARHGAGRRLVQRRARLHVRRGLHPVAALPHRPLPDRRRHPGPDAPARAGGARQDPAGGQLPPRHRARAR